MNKSEITNPILQGVYGRIAVGNIGEINNGAQTTLPPPSAPQPLGENDTQWMKNANCREVPTDKFFPSDGNGINIAQEICNLCVVKENCLEFSIKNHEDYGIWGGESERSRKRIRRQLRRDSIRNNN